MDKVLGPICGCKTESFFFVPLRDGRFICDGHGKNFDPFVILAEMIYICGAEYNLEGFMSFDIVMGKRYIAISCLMLLFLAACGDNGDKSVSPEDEPVSVENSSSSEKLSSSSVILSASKESSSSLAKSSSSSIQKNSSSSEMAMSSSSKDEKETKESSSSVKSSSSSSVILSASGESSSSSASLPNCSALLEGETGWSWDVPKECRFNPDIDYGTMTDSRDGKVYKTVKIGDQVWMAENLNYADSAETPSLKGNSWCYDNVAANCDVAGRLYTWAAAIDSVKLANDADNPQDCGYGKICTLPDTVYGICPSGWHLPDTTEWNTLFTTVGGLSTAGKALKSRRGWYTGWTDGGNGLDTFGFATLPVGYRRYNRDFDEDGYGAFFWSPAESDSDYAFSIGMGYGGGMARIGSNPKRSGFSIRCVKNPE